MKVAINKCYGGFVLSNAAHERLIALGVPHYAKWDEIPKNEEPYVVDYNGFGEDKYASNFRDYTKRNHPLLIQAIEELGEDKSSGMFGEIRVIEIPDDIEFEIDDYDGIESIHEKHRSW